MNYSTPSPSTSATEASWHPTPDIWINIAIGAVPLLIELAHYLAGRRSFRGKYAFPPPSKRLWLAKVTV